MKYQTVTFYHGGNLPEYIEKMSGEGWSVFNIWKSPTASNNPEGNNIIITFMSS